MTTAKSPQVSASPTNPQWTPRGIRNLSCTILALCALLGSYLVHASSSPAPAKDEPAPLWPYQSVLLAVTLGSTTISACHYAEKRFGSTKRVETLGGCLLAAYLGLGFVHFVAWLGYWTVYSREGRPYPSMWAYYLTLCACVNLVICLVLMPVEAEEDDPPVYGEHGEDYALYGFDRHLEVAAVGNSRSSGGF
ncbi:hypothetical protein B0A55_12287 [Friedmanniomyces simplex]|uniref:Uncharacterized protein n=1 Tax=Friedmanniomyces simplex TaxID=329884 RepID=A0A4U0VN67_9PEZI|nr:hypothetical protein B0A55_12287 [Friedmanniomyces simplex]